VSFSLKTTASEDLVAKLIPIWQRVLRRSEVRIEDNFFGLGGDIWSADRLFASIAQEKEIGRELPSSTIYRAPTIATLARALQQPGLPPFCPFVQLKAGNEKSSNTVLPPIFIVHGLAGTVPFYGLAQRIQTPNSIYGIQGQGLDGMDEPLDRIEDMAQLYLDSMNSLPNPGSCILIGYSFGGMVALEMAQRMAKNGSPAAMLVLIDAYPHPSYLSRVQRLRLMVRRAPARVARQQQKLSRAASSLGRRLRGRFLMGSALPSASVAPQLESLPRSFARTTLRVNERARIALERYRPRFYGGKIHFVKSGGDTYFPADPVPVWKKLATEFECEMAAGEHLNMVTTDYEGVAEVLTRYVNQVSPG
jgi:acetoacetyl-CoA synthetase